MRTTSHWTSSVPPGPATMGIGVVLFQDPGADFTPQSTLDSSRDRQGVRELPGVLEKWQPLGAQSHEGKGDEGKGGEERLWGFP